MNILLINRNATVERLVSLSVNKLGHTLAKAGLLSEANDTDYDLIIIDSDSYEESEVSSAKDRFTSAHFLLIAPKGGTKPMDINTVLEKPFLPTELVDVISSLSSASAPKEEAVLVDEEDEWAKATSDKQDESDPFGGMSLDDVPGLSLEGLEDGDGMSLDMDLDGAEGLSLDDELGSLDLGDSAESETGEKESMTAEEEDEGVSDISLDLEEDIGGLELTEGASLEDISLDDAPSFELPDTESGLELESDDEDAEDMELSDDEHFAIDHESLSETELPEEPELKMPEDELGGLGEMPGLSLDEDSDEMSLDTLELSEEPSLDFGELGEESALELSEDLSLELDSEPSLDLDTDTLEMESMPQLDLEDLPQDIEDMELPNIDIESEESDEGGLDLTMADESDELEESGFSLDDLTAEPAEEMEDLSGSLEMSLDSLEHEELAEELSGDFDIQSHHEVDSEISDEESDMQTNMTPNRDSIFGEDEVKELKTLLSDDSDTQHGSDDFSPDDVKIKNDEFASLTEESLAEALGLEMDGMVSTHENVTEESDDLIEELSQQASANVAATATPEAGGSDMSGLIDNLQSLPVDTLKQLLNGAQVTINITFPKK